MLVCSFSRSIFARRCMTTVLNRMHDFSIGSFKIFGKLLQSGSTWFQEMLASRKWKLTIVSFLCTAVSIQMKTALFSKVRDNTRCLGKILKTLNASSCVCAAKCKADTQCILFNSMQKMETCELLTYSDDCALVDLVDWSCYTNQVNAAYTWAILLCISKRL